MKIHYFFMSIFFSFLLVACSYELTDIEEDYGAGYEDYETESETDVSEDSLEDSDDEIHRELEDFDEAFQELLYEELEEDGLEMFE